jgi:hypothetical protein
MTRFTATCACSSSQWAPAFSWYVDTGMQECRKKDLESKRSISRRATTAEILTANQAAFAAIMNSMRKRGDRKWRKALMTQPRLWSLR